MLDFGDGVGRRGTCNPVPGGAPQGMCQGIEGERFKTFVYRVVYFLGYLKKQVL